MVMMINVHYGDDDDSDDGDDDDGDDDDPRDTDIDRKDDNKHCGYNDDFQGIATLQK